MTTSTFKELWRKVSTPALDVVAAPTNEALVTTQPVVRAYDLSLLQGMVGADSPALREIVQKFIRDTPSELDRLERAVAAYDLPAIGAQAHRLKSQVKLFGLDGAAGPLHQMEEIGKGKLPPENPAVLQQHTEEIKAVYEGATRALLGIYGTV